jgi:hypothetical protein
MKPLRYLLIVMVLSLAGYAAVFTVVGLGFERKTLDNVQYYTHGQEAGSLETVHYQAMRALHGSALFQAPRGTRVFLTGSAFEFKVLSLFRNAGAFGNTFAMLDYVVIAPSDIARDRVESAAPRFHTRSLHGVLAHEFTHLLLYWSFSVESLTQMPTWMVEGYADYIAQESSFPETEGMALFCAGGASDSPSFAYFKYRKVVGALLARGISFRALAAGHYDFAKESAAAREALCP